MSMKQPLYGSVASAETVRPEKKKKVYVVNFTWGNDYGDKCPEVRSITINVINCENKFDALKTSYDLVKELVNDVEPDKMDVRSKDTCG